MASKKELADMDINEFMSGALDDSDSNGDEDWSDDDEVSDDEGGSADESSEEEDKQMTVIKVGKKAGTKLQGVQDDDDEDNDDEADIDDESNDDDTSGEDEELDDDESEDDEDDHKETKLTQAAIDKMIKGEKLSRTKKAKASPGGDKVKALAEVPDALEEAEGVEKGKKQSSIDKHKQSMDTLKEKDPDFYKFLQENDQELLNFEEDESEGGDDDEDDDEEFDIDEDEEDDSDEEGPVHKLPSKLEEASDESDDSEEEGLEDEDDDEDDDQEPKVKRTGVTVTIAMVDKWGDQMQENNLQGFKELTSAFEAAIRGMPDEEDRKYTKYLVQGSNVFNAIVSLCLKGVHPMLQNLLKMDSKAIKRLALPSISKQWKNIHSVVREYLLQVIKLLTHMVDSAIVCVVLRHIHKLVPYFCCFPKMSRSLIKKLVPFWSTGEETVRVVAFLGLFTITRYMKKSTWLELILKQMYMAYVKNTKFTSPSTLPLITFMQRSMTEMFAINTQVTYQHAFVYIRQLAIHLRNAITIKKDQFQSVYNWQYIHCVWLWCRVLGTLHADETLKPLIYPLVQTSVGVIKLIPAAKYIPLRFSVIRALNILSDATGTFIPLLPHILDVFDLVDFNKRPVGVSFKPINFAVVLKLSTKQLAEKGFKDGLMDEIYEIILEHLVVHSHSISFPELALPVILKLKAFIKGSHIPQYSKLMKGLLDKIQENCQGITKKRDTATFSLADDQSVRSWEQKMKVQGSALSKHYTTYKPLRERELKTEEAGKDRMMDLNFPTISKRDNKTRKMKDDEKEEFKELFERDSDSEDDLMVRAERREQKKKEWKKERRNRRKNRAAAKAEEGSEDDDDDMDSWDDEDDGVSDDDDDSNDDDDSDDDEGDYDDDEDLGSDGDGKAHKAQPASGKKVRSKRPRNKEPTQPVDTSAVDGVKDVVADFELWSGDDEAEEKREKKTSKKRKGDKGEKKWDTKKQRTGKGGNGKGGKKTWGKREGGKGAKKTWARKGKFEGKA